MTLPASSVRVTVVTRSPLTPFVTFLARPGVISLLKINCVLNGITSRLTRVSVVRPAASSARTMIGCTINSPRQARAVLVNRRIWLSH